MDLDFDDTNESGAPNSLLNSFCFRGGGEQAKKSSNIVGDSEGDFRGEQANKSSNLAEDTVGEDFPKRLDVERPERALALIDLKEVVRLLCFRREGLVKLDDFLRLKT